MTTDLEAAEQERGAFSSRRVFILATIGSAVAANNAGGGSKDPVKGQGSSSSSSSPGQSGGSISTCAQRSRVRPVKLPRCQSVSARDGRSTMPSSSSSSHSAGALLHPSDASSAASETSPPEAAAAARALCMIGSGSAYPSGRSTTRSMPRSAAMCTGAAGTAGGKARGWDRRRRPSCAPPSCRRGAQANLRPRRPSR